MGIAGNILQHLRNNDVAYLVLPHPHTGSSQQTAEATHVSGDRLAKGVLLERQSGEHILAVLPASRMVDYSDLETHYGARLQPAPTEVLERMFPDCEPGAVPPFGGLYNLPTAVDETLFDNDQVYFEAGDHESVVRVGSMDFRSLLFGADFLPFSRRHTE